MDREEVLSLLRQRTGRAELIDTLARRYPDATAADELVPLAIELIAAADNVEDRLAHRIPELPETYRDVLRGRLQDKPFEQISEELDIDAAAVYVQCRKRLFSGSKPLPDYTERFDVALTNQLTFDSVRDEHLLARLLDQSASRAKLLAATEDVRFTIAGTLREWFERPKSKVLTGLAIIAAVSLLVRECGR